MSSIRIKLLVNYVSGKIDTFPSETWDLKEGCLIITQQHYGKLVIPLVQIHRFEEEEDL